MRHHLDLYDQMYTKLHQAGLALVNIIALRVCRGLAEVCPI